MPARWSRKRRRSRKLQPSTPSSARKQRSATAQVNWTDARDLGSEVVETLGHAGRTSLNGAAEYGNVLGRYGKEALTDAIEFGRQSLKAKCVKDLVELNVAFMSRRSQAMFASVSELNAIAQAKTVAAWSPLGETLRKAGEKTSQAPPSREGRGVDGGHGAPPAMVERFFRAPRFAGYLKPNTSWW